VLKAVELENENNMKWAQRAATKEMQQLARIEAHAAKIAEQESQQLASFTNKQRNTSKQTAKLRRQELEGQKGMR